MIAVTVCKGEVLSNYIPEKDSKWMKRILLIPNRSGRLWFEFSFFDRGLAGGHIVVENLVHNERWRFGTVPLLRVGRVAIPVSFLVLKARLYGQTLRVVTQIVHPAVLIPGFLPFSCQFRLVGSGATPSP